MSFTLGGRLDPGAYLGERRILEVYAGASDEPFSAEIELLENAEIIPPANLVITMDTDLGDIVLLWDDVPYASSYTIWESESSPDGPWNQLGTTNENIWVDTGAISSQPKRFYYVTANYEE